MIDDKIFKKIAITLCIVVMIFLGINLLRIFSDIKKNDRIIEYYIDQQRKESDSIIKARQNRIRELIREVYQLDRKIKIAETKIDSLNKEKQRIQYVFINKLKEIDKYDAKQLEEYWKNEFK